MYSNSPGIPRLKSLLKSPPIHINVIFPKGGFKHPANPWEANIRICNPVIISQPQISLVNRGPLPTPLSPTMHSSNNMEVWLGSHLLGPFFQGPVRHAQSKGAQFKLPNNDCALEIAVSQRANKITTHNPINELAKTTHS